jgi:hypothetical protein
LEVPGENRGILSFPTIMVDLMRIDLYGAAQLEKAHTYLPSLFVLPVATLRNLDPKRSPGSYPARFPAHPRPLQA